MKKNDFLIVQAVILIFITAKFTLLPRLIKKSLVSTLNLSNKEFWLAPQRRAQTFAAVRNYFEWFAVPLLALFIGINQLVYRANLTGGNFHQKAA